MLDLILAAGLLSGAPAAPPVVEAKYTPPAKNCPRISRFHANKHGKSVKLRKLGELPPANHYKAVYRTVRGCEVPVIAEFGAGR